MKKFLTVLAVFIVLVPFGLHIGRGNTAIARQEVSTTAQAYEAGAQADAHATKADTHGKGASAEIMAEFIMYALIALAFLYSIQAHPKAIKLSTALCVAFLIESLWSSLKDSLPESLSTPTTEFVITSLAMMGIVPIHHHLEARCSDLLLKYPLMPALRSLLKSWTGL